MEERCEEWKVCEVRCVEEGNVWKKERCVRRKGICRKKLTNLEDLVCEKSVG
jgi:hypothetical protein